MLGLRCRIERISAIEEEGRQHGVERARETCRRGKNIGAMCIAPIKSPYGIPLQKPSRSRRCLERGFTRIFAEKKNIRVRPRPNTLVAAPSHYGVGVAIAGTSVGTMPGGAAVGVAVVVVAEIVPVAAGVGVSGVVGVNVGVGVGWYGGAVSHADRASMAVLSTMNTFLSPVYAT